MVVFIIKDEKIELNNKTIESIKNQTYSKIQMVEIENDINKIKKRLLDTQGKYILFIRSGDSIEDITIEQIIKRIEEDKTDLVTFDWKIENNGKFYYKNNEKYHGKSKISSKEMLEQTDKEKPNLYNKLYKLDKVKKCINEIENIEELFEKYIKKCKDISIMHSPLYNILEESEEIQEKEETEIKLENTIIFMGFDYRYTGNSRYLYEQIKKLKVDWKIYFVTDDELVETENRILPNTKIAQEKINQAKMVIFESWIPETIKKNPKSIWIQLWHGTPLKKMLYDSEEKQIIEKNNNNKLEKFRDISRWDYLITDNELVNSFFRSSLLIQKEKILATGYPRVKYLLDNKDNEEYKTEIKRKYNIPENKKIIMYLPTWRDYNFETKKFDNSYQLNLNKLQKKLGEDYCVIYKNHQYLCHDTKQTCIDATKYETQEMLLIADFIITDYSSIMFDAFSIDIPVLLYCNDFKKYKKYRGVYQEIWEDIKELNYTDLSKLVQAIKNYQIDEKYIKIKKKYSYQKSKMELIDFVAEYMKEE